MGVHFFSFGFFIHVSSIRGASIGVKMINVTSWWMAVEQLAPIVVSFLVKINHKDNMINNIQTLGNPLSRNLVISPDNPNAHLSDIANDGERTSLFHPLIHIHFRHCKYRARCMLNRKRRKTKSRPSQEAKSHRSVHPVTWSEFLNHRNHGAKNWRPATKQMLKWATILGSANLWNMLLSLEK